MTYKGHFQVVNSFLELPNPCERVNISSFFNTPTDYNDENIRVNFERVLLLAKAYNQSCVAFVIEAKTFPLKWYDKILHHSHQIIETFIKSYKLNVYFLVLIDDL